MTPAQKENFNRLLNPRHIAFVGGADAIVAIGEARRRGFEGDYWPVNPKRREMAGLPCFTALTDLSEAPDAVFLAVPAQAAVESVRTLADMGAGGIVCYTAGFKEAGCAGADAEKALQEAVGDMALIGPNCYGVINYLNNSALWPFAHGGSSPGYGAAIITQSGMFSSDITMSQRSVPLAYMISAGNQAVMGQEDFIDYLCEDPAVRAIGVHIEGLQDVARFEQAALKALQHNSPIVALKTGSSAIGSALTVSHTGTLSGANELYDALFERTGVIKVTCPSQFLETLKLLCVLDVPKSNKVMGFTCSGGGATMLADHAETIDLSFPEFSPDDTEGLRELLPPIATVSNPLDYTTPIWGQPEKTTPVFETALTASGCDATILVQDYPAAGLDESLIYYRNDALAFAEAAKKTGIPAMICATLPENMEADTRRLLIDKGVAPMQGIHEALNAIAQGAAWYAAKTRILANPPQPLQSAEVPERITALDEAAGKERLANAGIPVPKSKRVSGAKVADEAKDIGFPVVLKMMGPKLAHKTEAGAVLLNVDSFEAAETAISGMRDSVARHDKQAVTDDFLIEAMAPPPLAELIVGLRRDAQFGAALTLGSGGILVELVGDAKTVLLPTSQEVIKQALLGLRVARLLSGFRGGPKADFEVLAKRLHTLCSYFFNHSDDLVELEINPLFVYENEVMAVDVLIHLRNAP
ncbi:MAG: acetate--CoA ligase family protein [Hyphomicrobiales bacterium]